MMADENPQPHIEPPEGSGWAVHGPHGSHRFKEGPEGRVVRLADVVRWLMNVRELPLSVAVDRVCAALEGEAPPLVYGISSTGWAAPENEPSGWFGLLDGWEDLADLPPQVAHARAAARNLRGDWLITPYELSRLANAPGYPVEFDSEKESPFDYFERKGVTSATVAVDFATAHALWGWGTVAALATVADVSPFPLADWPALVAYRLANKGKGWGPGNQLEIVRNELRRRTANERMTESDALAAMGKEFGLGKTDDGARKALAKVLSTERKRDKARTSALDVTKVKDGRKAA